MAFGYNIIIARGDTYTINLVHQNEAEEAIDITGFSVFFTVKRAVDNVASDSTAYISKKITSHTNPTLGQTEIPITASDTDSMEIGRYIYDIQLVSGAGDITTFGPGDFILGPDVTRRVA